MEGSSAVISKPPRPPAGTTRRRGAASGLPGCQAQPDSPPSLAATTPSSRRARRRSTGLPRQRRPGDRHREFARTLGHRAEAPGAAIERDCGAARGRQDGEGGSVGRHAAPAKRAGFRHQAAGQRIEVGVARHQVGGEHRGQGGGRPRGGGLGWLASAIAGGGEQQPSLALVHALGIMRSSSGRAAAASP